MHRSLLLLLLLLLLLIIPPPHTPQIVAADYSEGKHPTEHRNLLMDHMRMLESHPLFAKAKMVVCPENNMKFQALNLQTEVRRRYPTNDMVIILDEDRFSGGVRTDNPMKGAMAEGAKDDMLAGRMFIWEDFMSAAAEQDTTAFISNHRALYGNDQEKLNDLKRVSVAQVRKEFTTEVENFKRRVDPPKDPTRDPKVTYSGKTDGGFDDMVMAWLIANISSKIFYANTKYSSYH